jgi:hypothetical protein
MDVFAKVEQMWAGERSLQVLQHGLSPDARRLIELILHAEDDVFDTEVAHELHDEPNNAGKQLLPVSPSKGSSLSVETLLPSNTHCNEIMIPLFLFCEQATQSQRGVSLKAIWYTLYGFVSLLILPEQCQHNHGSIRTVWRMSDPSSVSTTVQHGSGSVGTSQSR